MDKATETLYKSIYTVNTDNDLLLPFLTAASSKKVLDNIGIVKNISRTLAAKAFNKGRHDKVTMAGLRLYPFAQYSAILDFKVCDLCKAMDRHIISTKDKMFQDNTFTPPMHPHCRCNWMFIKDGKGVKANWIFNKDFLKSNKEKASLKKLKWAGAIAKGVIHAVHI